MANCLIGLGANLADRAATIEKAVELLNTHADVRLLATSSLLKTTPVGGPSGQDEFLNAALLVETTLSPMELLRVLQGIETQLGRQRHERWAARNIDLDLLLYDDLVLVTDDLEIPHPRMSFRRFVIEPAVEIAPEMLHPKIGWSLAQLRDHLRDHPPYVAIAGPIGVGKSHLARRLCDELGGRLIEENVSDERLTAFYAQASQQHSASGEDQLTGTTRPTGLSWSTEIEFLQDRVEQLDRSRWPQELPESASLAISDYWFDQSLAFARVWLPAEQHAEYEERWQAARQTVVTPKLLVVLDGPLDGPIDALRQAISERGRPYESALTAETLARLRDSLLELVAGGGHGYQGPRYQGPRYQGHGPVLSLRTKLSGAAVSSDVTGDGDHPFNEVAAAIAAMQ